MRRSSDCLRNAGSTDVLVESPLSNCFWQETRLQQSLTSTVSTRIQASRRGSPKQQLWMAGAAAMSMRSTSGCGSLDVESHAWVVSLLRRLPKGGSLRMLTGRSILQRLVSVARPQQIEPDGKLKRVWYEHVPVSTSIDLVRTYPVFNYRSTQPAYFLKH